MRIVGKGENRGENKHHGTGPTIRTTVECDPSIVATPRRMGVTPPGI